MQIKLKKIKKIKNKTKKIIAFFNNFFSFNFFFVIKIDGKKIILDQSIISFKINFKKIKKKINKNKKKKKIFFHFFLKINP